MKKGEHIYRFCLKSGTFDKENPTFVIKAGKLQQRINTYYIPSDKQRYNYDLIFEKSPQTDIMIHCDIDGKLAGTATLKVDARKAELPNESLSVMNSKKQKIANLQCSLKKLQKLEKKPPIKIEVIQASYTDTEAKEKKENAEEESFIVLKYGDTNYQTDPEPVTVDQAPVWKKTFESSESNAQRIFVEAWKRFGGQNKFIGIVLVDVKEALGTEKDYELIAGKKKLGSVKIAVYKDDLEKKEVDVKINDKNFSRKRTIKVSVNEALLKAPSNKKGTVIRLVTDEKQVETTPVFKQAKELNFNQSFNLTLFENQQLTLQALVKDEMEEEIGRVSLKASEIANRKYELKLRDGSEKEVGTLYIECYDEELDIQEQISQNNSQALIDKSEGKLDDENKSISKASERTGSELSETAKELKSRYANRQSIHEYMEEVNSVLQQGLLKVAKQRPENPIKQLGLFLINYKK